jgi:uncharacterized protein YgbK (DUF1537 family)
LAKHIQSHARHRKTRERRHNPLIEKLIEKCLPLLSEPANLRIGLEGGATAMAFIHRMGWTRFEVIPEGHPGVGTLRPPGGPVLCVEPGSYPWPVGSLAYKD